MREWTPGQIIYRDGECVSYLRYNLAISHILDNKDPVTVEMINEIPGFSFQIAEKESEKYKPSIQNHLYSISAIPVESSKSQEIVKLLKGYHKRMGTICSIIKNNKEKRDEQRSVYKAEKVDYREQEKYDTEMRAERTRDKVISLDAKLDF